MLINGQWMQDFDPVQAVDDEGGFARQPSVIRNWITPDGAPGVTGDGGFKAEAGRYHLYVALICPWASRTLLARKLKGLEEVVSVTVLDPRLHDKVWRFGDDESPIGSQPDPHYQAEYLYQLYLRSDPHYTGQITVPVLWDRKKECIVNNESADIVRMFNSGFGKLADNSIDLYPPDLRASIDAVNERLYNSFNNGVYRAGFATTQRAYERAVGEVFASLEFIHERLIGGQEYLVGNRLTEADIRAFVTLVRFDSAYYPLFKTNLRQVRDYPRISDYVQRIYELPGVSETVNLEHIKTGYFSIRALNPVGLVPKGPERPW